MIGPLLLSLSLAPPAEVLPSFDVRACAWEATEIVLATEGDEIDGRFTVLETWYGDLEAGDQVEVGGLARFAGKEARTLSSGFLGPDPALGTVSCDEVVLFLTREGEAFRGAHPTKWKARDEVSAAWIEGAKAYGMRQQINPGPLGLTDLWMRRWDLRAVSQDVVAAREVFEAAVHVTDPALRARISLALLPAVGARARKELIGSLEGAGTEAFDVVRGISSQPTHRDLYRLLDPLLVQLDPERAAAVFAARLDAELEVFRARLDRLSPGWWNDPELEPRDRRDLQDHYGRIRSMLSALEAVLEGTDLGAALPAIARLERFWSDEPAFRGLERLSLACRALLESNGRKR